MNGDHYNTVLARPDFYMLFDNRPDWEERYIHKEYSKQLEPNVTFQQPCPDVYWFPIVTEKFCDDLVAIVEHNGKWSDGTNNDDRLQGGYEAVPTRDIHMTQVGLQSMYLKFLQLYVRPLQEAAFMGYYHNVSVSDSLTRATYKTIFFYSTASKFFNEFRCSVQTHRTTEAKATSRFIDVHNQHCFEQRGC